jgi:hypothetical protein
MGVWMGYQISIQYLAFIIQIFQHLFASFAFNFAIFAVQKVGGG